MLIENDSRCVQTSRKAVKMLRLNHCVSAEGARRLPQSTHPLKMDRDTTGLIDCKASIAVAKVTYEGSLSMAFRGRAWSQFQPRTEGGPEESLLRNVVSSKCRSQQMTALRSIFGCPERGCGEGVFALLSVSHIWHTACIFCSPF